MAVAGFDEGEGTLRVTLDMDAADRIMQEVIESTERATSALFGNRDLPIYRVLRYHLGWADVELNPSTYHGGKRIRPMICMLCCAAAGGDPSRSVSTAAAIELLHNFTLVHDDIQDRSETRHHHPTVWSVWGDAQAINAGDTLFALSQIALLDSTERGVSPASTLRLARAFNQTTLRIVEGQVLDLGYEQRWEISVDDYLRMIGGKTASIVAFAAWAGALLADADSDRQRLFRDFGEALGLGFQVRDDLLGIWGDESVTGKTVADDIRRRKKSLPIITLFNTATESERSDLREIYARETLDACSVNQVLGMLQRYGVEQQIQETVDRYHHEAHRLLHHAAQPGHARDRLEELLNRLATRAF